MGTGTIRQGSRGPEVVRWQQVLAGGSRPSSWEDATGAIKVWPDTWTWPLVADGDFGQRTRFATEAWQAAHGLVADGVVGDKSWAKAEESEEIKSEPALIRGFDASSVQGVINFAKLDKMYRFVILKAQEGNGGFDPLFGTNMKAAIAAGLYCFAYCFLYPLPPAPDPKKPGQNIYGRDPKEQAKMCVDRVYAFAEMRGRALFLDLEWPPPNEWAKWKCTAAQINDWCRTFCEEIELLTGVPPILYTYPWWWAAVSAADTSWAGKYGLWLAAYIKDWPKDGQGPKVPSPWKDYLFWQFDGDGGLKFPDGRDADFCVFKGTEDDLKRLANLI